MRASITRSVAIAWVAAAGLAGCGDNLRADARCDVPGAGPGLDPSGAWCERLSSYRLFDDLATQAPAEGVIPYAVNTPLFSDYAVKQRFLWVPPGEALTWSEDGAFGAPAGTVVVKTFGYDVDRRDPSRGRRLLETRLLVKTADAWRGASYVYPEGDPSDARLAVAGATLATRWIHDDGGERTNAYAVPNTNQCKNCHGEHDEVIDLLGPKARHLNRPGPEGAGITDQLQHLVDSGVLAGAPPPAMWPRLADALDPTTGTLDERARAWLDINCAHCHNATGPARTSGLFLDVAQTEPVLLGVCKPPVAAGRGSGGRAYGIVPGQPDASILVFRLESTEADIKMPELGRNLVHDEGVALIREWIAAMPGACP